MKQSITNLPNSSAYYRESTWRKALPGCRCWGAMMGRRRAAPRAGSTGAGQLVGCRGCETPAALQARRPSMNLLVQVMHAEVMD